MRIKKGIDAERAVRERTEAPEPPPVGTVLSWDKQPKTLNDIYMGRRRRSFARISGHSEEDRIRYGRLSFIKPGDWQEFDSRTLKTRIEAGEMEIHDPFELLALVADALADKGQEEAAVALRGLVMEFSPSVLAEEPQ